MRQFWIACWMPRDKNADYIYGITVAFRNNSTALKQFSGKLFHHKNHDKPAIVNSIDEMKRTKIGRTEWLHKTLIVNKEILNKGYCKNYWFDVDNDHRVKSYGQTQNMFNAIEEWKNQLFKTIPVWTGRYAYPGF